MEISNEELKLRATKIKWVFTDVDGTLSDGCVYYSADGELLKKFSLRDGTGFFLLHEAGLKVGIITGEDSPIVERRSEKLKVDKVLLNAVPKVDTLGKFLQTNGLSFDNVAYIGDDINDIKLFRTVGLSFAVADSSSYVKEYASVILKHDGGDGAFREAAEFLLSLKNININSIIENKL